MTKTIFLNAQAEVYEPYKPDTEFTYIVIVTTQDEDLANADSLIMLECQNLIENLGSIGALTFT